MVLHISYCVLKEVSNIYRHTQNKIIYERKPVELFYVLQLGKQEKEYINIGN